MSHPNNARRQRPQGQEFKDITSHDGMLTWEWVSEQMTESRNYWLCTTRPDGRPHAMPVWGVWVEDTFYFGTGPSSRKGRNLQHNPNAVVHLESGDETVIFEGTIEAFRDAGTLKAVFAAYDRKYAPFSISETMDINEPDGMYVLRPQRAFAWLEADFLKTAVRWTL